MRDKRITGINCRTGILTAERWLDRLLRYLTLGRRDRRYCWEWVGTDWLRELRTRPQPAGTGTPEVVGAGQVDLGDGRRIWIPPTGRPYWVGGPNAGPDLTDTEIAEHVQEGAA